jgi:hypothetical protein
MPEDKLQIGRLAMRHEGEMWNAYWAQPGTMEGAILLGSIRMSVVADLEMKDMFMTFMRVAVAQACKEATGVNPDWSAQPERAPEHERSGHG